jgi:NAD(P)-dependent dehydrogenase (short-subunit alcohol dehydrogenase family)
MGLRGKTAVVTGAASGIGKATAIGFGNDGASVALVDLDEEGANRVAKEIDAAGVPTMVCKVDLSNPAEIRSALQAVHQRFGSLDAVANVAGIYPKAKVPDVTEELWDRILSINLRGVFFCCQEAVRIMVTQGSGAIVNVASGAAFRAIEGHAVYSASKAGLVGMTRVLALECARKGVRVNVVAPGHTPSERWYDRGQLDPGMAAVADTLVPGRFMTPEEQANAIIWLCSDLASGVNGAIINVNGGNHMPQG